MMRNTTWIGLAVAALTLLGATAGCSDSANLSGSRRYRLTSQDFADSQYTTHSLYLRELGGSYTAEERYQDAMEVYTDSLTLNYGEDFESQVAMGRLWERRGDTNRALAHYARAKSIRPDHIAGCRSCPTANRPTAGTPTPRPPTAATAAKTTTGKPGLSLYGEFSSS